MYPDVFENAPTRSVFESFSPVHTKTRKRYHLSSMRHAMMYLNDVFLVYDIIVFATNLLDLLDSLGLCQHVTQSTHELGHTIDLIITRQSDSIIHGSPTTDRLFSDHLTVLTTLRATKPAITSKELVYRKIKSADLDTFRNDLVVSELCQETHKEFNELVECYIRSH